MLGPTNVECSNVCRCVQVGGRNDDVAIVLQLAVTGAR